MKRQPLRIQNKEERINALTARTWYRGWQEKCRRAGYPGGMQFGEFCSQMRAEGALSILQVYLSKDPDKLSYDADAVLLADLHARLMIADAWLRGELDRRPTKDAIRLYERLKAPLVKYELPATIDLDDEEADKVG